MTVADDAMASGAAEPEPAMVVRFDPMLRSLLTFGLVERDPEVSNGDGSHWRLVPAVQRRLELLVSPAPPAEKLIYFGHRCGSCGEHGPTRFSSGIFLCDTCRRSVEQPEPRLGATGA